MTTHEEAREKLQQIAETTVYHFATYDEDGCCNDDDYEEYPVNEELIKDMSYYTSQQEKITELLGLYKEKTQLLLDDVYVARPYIEIDIRIEQLEKELREMA